MVELRSSLVGSRWVSSEALVMLDNFIAYFNAIYYYNIYPMHYQEKHQYIAASTHEGLSCKTAIDH